jgi:RHS repeat-associated protein
VVWRWQGEAFGGTLPTGSVTVNLRFPGQYYDTETQLHYNWHRYYEPQTGRYITSDPIGLEGGLNTFGYVYGNPQKFIDPAGLDVRLMCRLLDDPIAGGQLGQKHCFVYVTCPEEGWSYVLSLFQSGYHHGVPHMGRKQLALPSTPGLIDDPFSPFNEDNILVSPSSSDCNTCAFEKHVMEKFLAFPAGNVPYTLVGPNSNSFAAGLVTSPEFGTSAPSVSDAPGFQFGWSAWR